MSVWFHRRLQQEEGISLIEMLVSILLMGLVLSALGSTLMTSMASARQNEGRTHATALANQEFEALQGLPWDRLGLRKPPTDSNWQDRAMFGTLSLHSVEAPSTVSNVPRALTANVSRGGRSYEVRRFIVWRCNNTTVETSATGCTDTQPRYKQFRIAVSWNEGGKPHTTRLEGKRTLGSGGAGGGGGTLDLSDGHLFRVVSLTVTPDPVYVHANGRLVTSDPALCVTPPSPGCGPRLPNAAGTALAAIQIDAETSHAASGVTVHWGGTPVAMTAVANSNGLRWTHQIFAGSNQAFAPAGPLDVTATATQSGTGVIHADTTQAYIAYPIQVVLSTLTYDNNAQRAYTGLLDATTGDRICVSQSSKTLRNDHPFKVAMRGLSADDSVWLGRADGPTWLVDLPVDQLSPLNNSAETVFDGVVPASLVGAIPSATTTVTFRFSWTRGYDGVSGSWNFPVVVKTVGTGYAGTC